MRQEFHQPSAAFSEYMQFTTQGCNEGPVEKNRAIICRRLSACSDVWRVSTDCLVRSGGPSERACRSFQKRSKRMHWYGLGFAVWHAFRVAPQSLVAERIHDIFNTMQRATAGTILSPCLGQTSDVLSNLMRSKLKGSGILKLVVLRYRTSPKDTGFCLSHTQTFAAQLLVFACRMRICGCKVWARTPDSVAQSTKVVEAMRTDAV